MSDYTYQRVADPAELNTLVGLTSTFANHTFKYDAADIAEYQALLVQPHAFQMVVKDDQNRPVGFVAAAETLFPNNLFIAELLVDQSVQRQGIGRTLLNLCVEFARQEKLSGLYTETEIWNTPAQQLYENFGFKVVANPAWQAGLTYQYIS
ncbi:MAG: GNAT family N-acetyltransferase [Dehalococcoidales bacterium]|nr:GNAT family N-acetyltransferase [Dehalococcoidales bacterium]